MFNLSHVFTHGEDPGGFLSGITDAEVISILGVTYLATSSRPDAGLAVHDIANNGALSVSDKQVYTPTAQGLSGVSLIAASIGGQDMILTAGPGHAGVTGYAVGAAGNVMPGETLVVTSSAPVAMAQSGSHSFAALAEGGIACFGSGAGLQSRGVTTPFPPGSDPRISGLVAAQAGGEDYLIGISATGDRIDAYRVSASGTLGHASSIGAADGLGINTPIDVKQVVLGGRTFVLVGSSASSTITVLELSPGGVLIPTDHVLDTLHTRFGGLATLGVIERDGHVYVAAGGADDGLTLMELLRDGRLVYHASTGDWQSVTLDNVSAISGFAYSGGLRLYAASASEPGLTEFFVNLTTAGEVRIGTAGDDALTGGSARDILVAGNGADTLTGGPGEDLFVVSKDGSTDTIADYERGVDVIDVSALDFFYDPGQLSLVGTPSGADLYFSNFQLRVHSSDGAELDLEDFRFDLSLNHLATGNPDPGGGAPSGLNILGTASADMLMGGARTIF